MKRVLNGVRLLMAIGLVVALAACAGSDSSIKRDRDQAQAAAEAAEAAKAAAEAAQAQAEAAKAAAEAAQAQAEADKAAAEAAQAQAEADKAAAETAQAEAEADKAAAETAQAEAEAAKAAAETAKAEAEAAKTAAETAQAQAEADKLAAEAAQAQAEADKLAAEAAQTQAEADKTAAEAALTQAEADKLAAQAALTQAEADKLALEEQLAGVAPTIEELEVALTVAKDAHTAAADAKAAADMALAAATEARMMAQTAVDESEPEGLAEAIAALQTARDAETAAEAAAMAAAEVATAAYMDLADAKAALAGADTGPASETLTAQERAADIKGAKAAYGVLAGIRTVGDSNADPITKSRMATSTLSVSHGAAGLKFSAKGTVNTDPVWAQADVDMAPAIGGEWVSGTLTATGTATGPPNTDEKGTGFVYSNIEAPEHKLFAVTHGANPTLTSETPADQAAAWKLSRIAPDAAYGGGTVAGTYDGVPGTFTCTASPGNTCPTNLPPRRGNGTIVDPASTVLNPTGTTWKFKPTDEAAMVAVQDDSYLYFGYWLSKSKTAPEDFAVWYGASNTKRAVASDPEITALDEKVEYTGNAAGKYVIRDDVENTAEAGYFTAKAVLTADFTALAGEDGRLEGKISGFTAGDSAPLGDLELTLKGPLEYDAETLKLDQDATEDAPTVTAKAGGSTVSGVTGGWEAELFGTEKNTNLPTSVAGAFDATIPNQAIVVGGFGATK